MVLGADYCPWCRKFERKTLASTLVKPRLDKEVVTLVVDKKYDKNFFPSKFQTQITPRIFFINPHDETIIFQSAGYVNKKEFFKSLDKVQELYKGHQ
jgi:thioredoxin-related protein